MYMRDLKLLSQIPKKAEHVCVFLGRETLCLTNVEEFALYLANGVFWGQYAFSEIVANVFERA